MKQLALLATLALQPLLAQYSIEPAVTNKQSSQFSLTLVGGLNFATKSSLRSTDTVSSYTNFSGGLEAWYGGLGELNLAGLALAFEPGLFLGYTPVMSYTDSVSRKSSDLKLPAVAFARLVHSTGIYLGAGAGYAYTLLKTNDVTDGRGGAIVAAVTAGYQLTVWQNLQIGGQLNLFYFFQDIESANGTKTGNSNLNILPFLTVSYGF